MSFKFSPVVQLSFVLLLLAHSFNFSPVAQLSFVSLLLCAGEELEALQKPTFWKLAANASVHVRAAFYTAVRALTLQAPSLLHDTEAADGDANSKLKLASAAVVQGLSDKDSAAHSQMWECVLIFCRAFPSALAAMDLNKAVVPRLLTLVKNGCYGSAVESFPCLVPFAQLCTSPAHSPNS